MSKDPTTVRLVIDLPRATLAEVEAAKELSIVHLSRASLICYLILLGAREFTKRKGRIDLEPTGN